MNDTWLAERLATLADTAGPPAPSVAAVLAAGRRVRRRRQRAIGGGAAVTLVAATVSVVVVAGHSAAPRKVTLAAEPSPSATPGDEGLTANYWFTSYVDTGYESVDGVAKATVNPAYDTWYGNNRPTVTAFGPQDHLTQISQEPGPVYTNDPSRFDLSTSWSDLWSAPTDSAGLDAWIVAHRGIQNDNLPNTVSMMLTQPAPLALRKALVALLTSRPRATVTQGSDDDGRPAQIITTPQKNPDYQTSVYYIDPTTADLLESKVLNGKPSEPSDLPEGSVYFQDVYHGTGPVDTAPTPPATKPAPEVIAPNTTSTPTCTPGKPEDPSDKVAVQLAKICLPDPVAGYPVRVDPDGYGDSIGRSFVIARAPKSKESLRLQIDANDQYFLSAASTPKPDAKGKVGMTTYVASTTVLGVTASEVTDTDGNKMLVLEKDGLGIEIVGTPKTPYTDLVTVVDEVQGIGPA